MGMRKETRVQYCSQCYKQQERKGDILGKGSEQHGLLRKDKKKKRVFKVELRIISTPV